MQWLAPTAALIAAGITIPLLVLLYFLKLKRHEQVVSSTLLWRRAVQDFQVNAPFQKLRRNLLLLIQLLVLLAMLAALGRPVLLMTAGQGKRYVLLIDRSASMSATDIEPSRLAVAKLQALKVVDSLRGRVGFSLQDASDQAMVVAFAGHAQVMCNFTSDKRQLRAAIEAIQPSDGRSSLAEALTVAQAFAQSAGDETNDRSAVDPAQMELFSDGKIRHLTDLAVTVGKVSFHRIGNSADNLGIVALQARRSYEKPEKVDVFASLANFGPVKVTCDVQLTVNGRIRAVRSVTVPPRRDGENNTSIAGEISVTFTLDQPGPGTLAVRQLQADKLPCDDEAWTVIAPPKKLSALLVTEGNVALESALKACPLAKLDIRTPAEFEAMDHEAMTVEPPYDVIVLDNCTPSKLPRCRYIAFGRPPAGFGCEVVGPLTNQVVVDWRGRHPALLAVDLGNLFAGKCWKLSLPRDADVLAEFNDSPALAVVRRNGSMLLLAGFDVMETNWPFEPSFVMFCYNALSYLAMETAADGQLRVGEAITLEGLAPETSIVVEAPGTERQSFTSDETGAFRYARTDRAGIYSVIVGDAEARRFAVNLLDVSESDIAPADHVVIAGREIKAQDKPVGLSNVELWPILLLVALALVCVEWFVYNAKARLPRISAGTSTQRGAKMKNLKRKPWPIGKGTR